MAEAKVYRRVSTAGMARDPAFRSRHRDERFWWRIHEQSCARRDITNLLTIDEHAEICSRPCHYCGAEPIRRRIYTRRLSVLAANGIDRVDNALPYSAANCVACCKLCNAMKSDLSREDFLAHVARIARFQRLAS